MHHFKQIMEERTNWTLQRLFDLKKDQELPWLGWGQFSNIVAVMTEIAIEENNLQPVIDETWLHRQNADYDGSSTVRRDFERTWNHSRKSAPISIEDIIGYSCNQRYGFYLIVFSVLSMICLRNVNLAIYEKRPALRQVSFVFIGCFGLLG